MAGVDPAGLRPVRRLPAETAGFVVPQTETETDHSPGAESLPAALLGAGTPLGGEVLGAAGLEVTSPHNLRLPLVAAVLVPAQPGLAGVGLGEDAVDGPGLRAGAAAVGADTPPSCQPLLPALLVSLAVLLRLRFGLLLTVAETSHFPVELAGTTGRTAVTPGSHQPDVRQTGPRPLTELLRGRAGEVRTLGVRQETSAAVLGSAVNLPLPHPGPAGDGARTPGLNHPVSGELLFCLLTASWLGGRLGCHDVTVGTGSYLAPPLGQVGRGDGGRAQRGRHGD